MVLQVFFSVLLSFQKELKGRSTLHDLIQPMGTQSTFENPLFLLYGPGVQKIQRQPANNPQYDTAADIVNVRFLARSHVSISIKELERLGYLEGRYNPGNHKTIHLSILEPAAALVADGQRAQQDFYSILFQDADPADAEAASRFLHCVSHNIRSYLESREKL